MTSIVHLLGAAPLRALSALRLSWRSRNMLAGPSTIPSAFSKEPWSSRKTMACIKAACETMSARPSRWSLVVSVLNAGCTLEQSSANDSPRGARQASGCSAEGGPIILCGVRSAISDHVRPSQEPKRISRNRGSTRIATPTAAPMILAVSSARIRSEEIATSKRSSARRAPSALACARPTRSKGVLLRP